MLVKQIVNRPITIVIAFALFIGIGTYIATDLDLDLFPEFTPPILIVATQYSGAGPEQIEDRITRLLEGQLSNISNLKEISSTSRKGSSIIRLNFEWGQDLSEATNEIRDKIEFVKRLLPEDAQSPQIFKFDPSMMPIMYFSISGNKNQSELYDLAADIISPKFEQIDGVSMVSVEGGLQPIIRIEVKQDRLDALGLTLTGASNGIVNKIMVQNSDSSGGQIYEGDKTYIMKASGEYKSIEDIKETVIMTTKTGKSVRVADVATVFMGFKDRTSILKIDNKQAMILSLYKQSGGNSIDVANNIMEKYNDIVDDLPAGVKIEKLYDMTTFIRTSVSGVVDSLISGMILAMIVIFLFLRSFKSTAIIGFSIPISLLITLSCMYFAGLTLNLLSLTGLVLGIGMIVDSSIVILENIFRYREKGSDHETASILGATEMMGAIIGSTLTTVCVFLPLVLFKKSLGIIGVMTTDLAFTIIIALLSSLIVSITLVPVLTSKFLRLYTTSQKPIKNKILSQIDKILKKWLDGLDELYKKILRFLLNKKTVTLIIIFVIFLVSMIFSQFLGLDLMPSTNDDMVVLNVELPVGTKLEKTFEVLEDFEKFVSKNITKIEHIMVSVGGGNSLNRSDSNSGQIQIFLPNIKDRVESSSEVQKILRKNFTNFPDATFKFSSGRGGGGSQNPIDILIQCNDLNKAKITGLEIIDLLNKYVPEIVDPDLDASSGLPQAEIIINRQKAYSLGVNMSSIGSEILASINSVLAGYYRVAGKEYEIRVVFRDEDRSSVIDLERITVSTLTGKKVPVSTFAEVKITEGPTQINRVDQTRVIHLTAALNGKASVTDAQSKINDVLEKYLIKDDDVFITYGGDVKELKEIGGKMVAIMIIALFLVFGVMASQFEDLIDPFIIFISIFTLLIGVIWIHIIGGKNLSAFSLVGMVMLVGIVVNNGIVLVDYTNLLKARGYSIFDACVEAGGNRLRPILMTSLTTILGMLPMALSSGEGSDMVQPIGITVLGGMVINTFMTLILVPILWYIFNARKDKKRLKKVRNEKIRNNR